MTGPNQTPRTSLRREAKFLPPEEDPYQVAVATKEEIDAAAARQAEREFMAGGHTAGLG